MAHAASDTGFRLTDAQRLDWLRLIRSENIGPRTFRSLLNRYGGAAAALEAIPHLPAQRGRIITLASASDCAREYETLTQMGGRLIALGEDDYPMALRMIDAPPPLISVLGNVGAFKRSMVAFVGSRNASAVGLAFTERLARDIGAADFVIVSGLARGIDARAHRAALSTGTIAVVAGGLNCIYPAEHRPLLDEICASGGAIVSEMPLDWEPRGRDFPRRNRIVAGLCLGTVVIEAARRSGSLITARFANEMGREVFAVPGSPLDPRAEGTNDLIRQGATMCVRAEDVLTNLRPLVETEPTEIGLFRENASLLLDASAPLWDEWEEGVDIPHSDVGQEFDEAQQDLYHSAQHPPHMIADVAPKLISVEDAHALILELLGPSPIHIDDLVRISEIDVSLVQQVLFELDLQGRLERQRGMMLALIG